MVTKASTPSETIMTKGQEKKLRDLMASVAGHVADLAPAKIKATPAKWQEAFGKMDQLRNKFTDFVLGELQELTFCLLKRRPETIPVPATEEFIVTKELLEKKYNIRWRGSNFDRLFLGKKCKAAKPCTVAFHTLQKSEVDGPIRSELGQQAKMTLGQMLWIVQRQMQGTSGPLLVNGYGNIGYVDVETEDEKVETWAVRFRWRSDDRCWHVAAYSVERPGGWNGGHRFLSSELS